MVKSAMLIDVKCDTVCFGNGTLAGLAIEARDSSGEISKVAAVICVNSTEQDNGGCSDICIFHGKVDGDHSVFNGTTSCDCPFGFLLGLDGFNCSTGDFENDYRL